MHHPKSSTDWGYRALPSNSEHPRSTRLPSSRTHVRCSYCPYSPCPRLPRHLVGMPARVLAPSISRKRKRCGGGGADDSGQSLLPPAFSTWGDYSSGSYYKRTGKASEHDASPEASRESGCGRGRLARHEESERATEGGIHAPRPYPAPLKSAISTMIGSKTTNRGCLATSVTRTDRQ